MAKLIVHRKLKSGRTITYKVKDKGKPGRTPKAMQWYHPKVHTGWEKNLPASVRRARVLRAHKGDLLSSYHAMDSLAKVSTDKTTKIKARADAEFFRRKLK